MARGGTTEPYLSDAAHTFSAKKSSIGGKTTLGSLPMEYPLNPYAVCASRTLALLLCSESRVRRQGDANGSTIPRARRGRLYAYAGLIKANTTIGLRVQWAV